MTRDSALQSALLDTGFDLTNQAGEKVHCRPLSPPAFVILRRTGCVLVDPKADKAGLDEVDMLQAFTTLAFVLSADPREIAILSRDKEQFAIEAETFGAQFSVGEFTRLMEGLDAATAGIAAAHVTAKKKQPVSPLKASPPRSRKPA